MNKYRILLLSNGSSRSVICEGFDLIAAIQNNCLIASEIVKAEFIGSSFEEDLTQ